VKLSLPEIHHDQAGFVSARSQAPAWERSSGSSSFESREAGASLTAFPSWSLGTSKGITHEDSN